MYEKKLVLLTFERGNQMYILFLSFYLLVIIAFVI